MRFFLLYAVLIFPLSAEEVLIASSATARAITLPEAYRLALARSEVVALSMENHEEVVAKAAEIFSNILPRVTMMGTDTVQQVPKGTTNQFLQGNREQGWVTAHQPIFAGLREFLAYRAVNRLGESAQLLLERAKHLLYQDTARAYLDLRLAQDEIVLRSALVAVTVERVKELRRRIEVGRSRRSELLAAESALAQALAQVEQSRAKERAAQFRLRFLTGVEDQDLAPVDPPEPGGPPTLAEVLAKARARPDVAAKRAEAAAAELTLKVVARKRWPTIAVDANYYFQRPPSFTDRVKWDATIVGSLPLYAGGETSAQVHQQESRVRAAANSLTLAARQAELEARTAREDLTLTAQVVAALAAASKAAEANAKAQAEDYRLGQVTNLDVLGSLNALQQTRLSHNQARLDASWARVRLEVAAGVPGGPL